MTDHLTCRQAFDRLDEYLDRELDPREAARVAEHLAVCENCAREFQFEVRLLDGVRAKLARIGVPNGLAGRITTALTKVPPRNSA